MGACANCNKFCLPSEKNITFSEYTSPKYTAFKPDLTPLVITRTPVDGTQSSPYMAYDSPEDKPRVLRKNSGASPGLKKGFLARAREKNRKSTQIPSNSSDFDDFFLSNGRSLTIVDDDQDSLKYQTRISLVSPDQNDGDFELIENY